MTKLFISICLTLLLLGPAFDSGITNAAVSAAPMTTAAKQLQIQIPSAPGGRVHKNNEAVIDYTNIADGYIMVKYLKQTSQALRVLITAPNSIVYTYPLDPTMEFEVLPLSEGNGVYKVVIYKQSVMQTQSNTYSLILSLNVDVRLNNEFAPFLGPNRIVNFNKNSLFLDKTAEFAKLNNNRAAIDAINRFIVKNMKYEKKQTADKDSWYIPSLDHTYKELTGMCIDYATLMVAMARSLGIPAKLITGYTREECHAWVEVYLEPTGWERWDPTVESISRVKRNTQQLINDDKNYIQMFQY